MSVNGLRTQWHTFFLEHIFYEFVLLECHRSGTTAKPRSNGGLLRSFLKNKMMTTESFLTQNYFPEHFPTYDESTFGNTMTEMPYVSSERTDFSESSKTYDRLRSTLTTVLSWTFTNAVHKPSPSRIVFRFQKTGSIVRVTGRLRGS